jgi:hypothetical protein
MIQDPHNLATAIYYTFSTIAQSLAGAVGLLAAFAVLRLSNLDLLLREEVDRIKMEPTPEWPRRAEALTLASTGRYPEFLAVYRQKPNLQVPADGVSRLLWAETLLAQRQRAYDRLLGALAATAVAILVSVLVLMSTPWLVGYQCTTVVLLFGAPAIVATCLLFYVRAITALLGP